MITKKICMLGSFSVGKTSLVGRYVHSVFSDKYLSTVGVKISKKELSAAGKELVLVLWDMEGKDKYVDINTSYLRGAMGFFVVADGTRRETLDMALELRERAIALSGPIPCRLLINKADMVHNWEITPTDLEKLGQREIKYIATSAKTGLGVAEAFEELAIAMLEADNAR